MINRREALIGISAVALGVATPSAPALAGIFEPVLPGAAFPAPGSPAKDADSQAVDGRLRKDLARMASRADSEEGVPVFLACVNLVVDKSSQRAPQGKVTKLNAVIVSEFRQNAAAWERIQPNSPDGDVGKLIQVLAERDFSSGGKEQA